MVNKVPIKFIIDSVSPVTLIPEFVFNDIITIDHPFRGEQPKNCCHWTNESNRQSNKETIELPLQITRAETSSLMGLDRMQRLKINVCSNNESIQIHKVKVDITEKRILKLQNDFKVCFTKIEIKNLYDNTQPEDGTQMRQQKGRQKFNTPLRPSSTRIKTIDKTRILGKRNSNH